jgi:predicted SprT family Zn-dependent metalloprotease
MPKKLSMQALKDPEIQTLQNFAWIETRAKELLTLHGLDVLGWRFEFSRDKLSLGKCKYREKVIAFSEYYEHIPREEILDTILHEIAHALVGSRVGHNYQWKAKAREIGARPERLAPPDVYSSAKYNYVMKCPSCGKKWYRYRMKRRNFEAYCNSCGPDATLKIYRLRKEERAK